MLPFDVEQFFEVFATYNTAVWPAPLVAYGLGLLALAFLFGPGSIADRVTSVVLGLMWLWTGAAYHWLHFAAINRAALPFGAFFVLQGALFLYAGWTRRLAFSRMSGVRGAAGLALILYSTILYPLLGIWFGHAYPAVPMFGITPCPVTIFTFGCLLLSRNPPWWILVVPVLWSLIGGSAAFLLNVPQDWVLLASGAIGVALLIWTRPIEARPAG